MSLAGQQLGRYHLLHLLGTGGMGEVYLAEDSTIHRQLAIKVIKSEGMPYPDGIAAQEARRLFLREVKAIAALQHPAILPLFDYGEVVVQKSVVSYMVMPYCQDGSLETWLHQRGSSQPLSLHQLSYIVGQAADALHYAHQKQIVHQDVKPSNFLIHRWKTPDAPDVLLADFGIAKFLATSSQSSHAIRGTPLSMAPEQWEGHPVPATDQYALAVMLYQLLTGYPPFQGGPGQMMYQHLTMKPSPPSARRSGISSSVDAVVLKGLQKKPEERFATILAFAQAFHEAVADGSLSNNQVTFQSSYRTEQATQTIDHTLAAKPAPLVQAPSASSPAVSSKEERLSFHRETGQHSQTVNTGKRAAIVLLVLLLLLGSIGGTILFLTQSTSQNSSVPPPLTERSTTVIQTTTQADTAARSSQMTATAQALSRNPYPPNTGTLVIDDPLSNNAKGYSWEEGARDQGTCTFTGGAYHSNIPLAGYFHSCLALATDFSDFAFEVQMTLSTGSAGGIVFRADRATTHLYYFTVDRAGGYLLKAYYDKAGDATVKASGSGAPFTGVGTIGVVAQGGAISLYVNRTLVQQVTDATFTHGQLGVVVYQGEAAFSNAKIWTL